MVNIPEGDTVMQSAAQKAFIPTPCVIQRRKKETHDTFTLDLVRSHGNNPFSFSPGQFNMLYMYGTGEVPISISGNPDDEDRLVHTIRAYGAVTSRMMTLKKGDMVGVRGPFGNGWPVDAIVGNDILLVAGGIGIAPLRPVLHYILSRRDAYGKVTLLYGERTPGDLIYRREVEQWRSRFDMIIDVTVDSSREGWRGNVGVVTTLIPRMQIDPMKTSVLMCGPEVMMYYAIEALEKKGVKDDRIYVSMERNMKCGVGFCGHCQFGPYFVCKDGPVFPYSRVKRLFRMREM